MTDRTDLLILVHPGSCCGSATFNLGKSDARVLREGLCCELENWKGSIAVIDGELSEEIADEQRLFVAIEGALERARSTGGISRRIVGQDLSDFDQTKAAAVLIEEHVLDPAMHSIFLTGAWFDPNDLSGCVNSVARVFQERGFAVDVLDSAFPENGIDWDHDDSDEEAEDGVVAALRGPAAR